MRVRQAHLPREAAGFDQDAQESEVQPREWQAGVAQAEEGERPAAMIPKEGDTFRLGEQAAVVKIVTDGEVLWEIANSGDQPIHRCEDIAYFCMLADRAVDSGATLNAPGERPLADSDARRSQ